MDANRLRWELLKSPLINKEVLVKDVVGKIVPILSSDSLQNPDLEPLLGVLNNIINTFTDKTEEADRICDSISGSICLPILHRLQPLYDSRTYTLLLLSRVASLQALCSWLGHTNLSVSVLDVCSESLNCHICEKTATTNSDLGPQQQTLDIVCALEVLKSILRIYNDEIQTRAKSVVTWNEKIAVIFKNLLSVLIFVENQKVLQITTQCVILYLKLDDDNLSDSLESCWNTIQSIWKSDYNSSKPCMLLCSLANYFLPAEGGVTAEIDVRTSESFWDIVQEGISSDNTLDRKQSIYLLKRTVDLCQKGGVDVTLQIDKGDNIPKFWWSKQCEVALAKVWEDFILLMETLEEKQVHVIKPLLPRMQSLIKATALDQGVPLLHTSWLTSIIRRALKHESVTVMRWAAGSVLFIDLELCPLLSQGQEEYICKEFLLTIQDAKNFNKSPDALLGTASNVAVGLCDFFGNCWRALKTELQRVLFFKRVMDTLSSNMWGPLPVLFMGKGLSQVPPSCLFDKSVVLNLRKMLAAVFITLNSYISGAIQCFYAEALINLVDTRSVMPKDLAAALSIFSVKESLQRGTTLWKKVVGQIQQFSESKIPNWTCTDIQNYLQKEISTFLQVSEGSWFLSSTMETVQIVRFTLLAVDSKVIPLVADVNKPQTSLSIILGELTEIVNTVTSRPYMPAHKAERAIDLLLCFTTELGTFSGNDEMSALIHDGFSNCHLELLRFIQQRMMDGWRETKDLSSIELCEKAVSFVAKCFQENSSVSCLQQLVSCSIQTLRSLASCNEVSMERQIQKMGASAVLSSVASVYMAISIELTQFQQDLVEEILLYAQQMEITLSFPRPPTVKSREEWGRITSKYLSDQWMVVLLCLTLRQPLHKSATAMLDLCLESVPLTKVNMILVVFRCAKFLIAQVIREGSVVKVMEMLDVAWSLTQEDTKGTQYLTVMEDFVAMAFQPELLCLPADSPVINKLIEYAELLLELGEEKNGLYLILSSHLCSLWSDEQLLPHMTKFYSVVASACIYGTIHKRPEKQTVEISAYIKTLGPSCSVNELMKSIPNDTSVRVSVISLLLCLHTKSSVHRKVVQGLIDALIDRHWVITHAHKGTTFPNSMVHRQKNRIFQFLIFLEPFLEQEKVESMWQFCTDVMGQANQPSIRNLAQWLTLRLIHRYKYLVDKLLHLFLDLDERNTTVICSLLGVVALLGPHLSCTQQIQYYKTAISAVLPWCMAHHFNTRIHAQVAMMKMWAQCKKQQLTEILSSFPFVDSVCHFIEESKRYNSTKNLTKLMENFFMKDFDFQQDFSVETIFHTFPRLACIMDDEWICPQMFNQSDTAVSWIPLLNPTDTLRNSEAGTWKIYNNNTAAGDDEEEEESSDVQKKIMPWRLMTPDEEVQEELNFSKKRHEAGGLVLVTSLIDKLPNLGGLCRTSEIFGISEFVIGKLKYLEDKVFKVLSVTAHKWLPIKEVYKSKLCTYLMEKKQEGYTLVGVEQTANSVSLTDFNFPYKSLLLLGNEKEGIPVELINMLDVCVEIPQQGIIRSLNVHVSGALLVWEYRRQQLMNCKSDIAGTST